MTIYDAPTVTYDEATNDLGLGTASPSARLHVIDTVEQQRLGYDAATYLSMTVSNLGAPAGAIHKDFTDPAVEFPLLDPTTGNPVGVTLSHGEVYAMLWSLYMALAAERDAATVEGD
jgi:hypothetical protein